MEKKKTFCAFCSLECDLAVRMPETKPYFSSVSIMEQDFDLENVNDGSICAKGNFTVDYINHPKRVEYTERHHNIIATEEAFDRIKVGLSQVQAKHGKDSVGIISNGNISGEEIAWVKKLAVEGFKNNNYGFFLPDDGMVASGLLASGYNFNRPSIDDLNKSDNVLVVGDAFYEHPVIAKKVLKARYEDRKRSLWVIDPRYSNTAWFADVHLQCRPGTEGLVLMALAALLEGKKEGEFEKLISKVKVEELAEKAGVSVENLKRVADGIAASGNLSIVLSDIFGKIGNADVCSVYCNAIASGAPDKRHYYPLFINQSIFPIEAQRADGESAGAARIIEDLMKGKIKGLILLGVDLLSSFPSQEVEKGLKGLEFFCCSDTFRNDTNEHSDILLPAGIPIENPGKYYDLDGKVNKREFLIKPPAAGMSELTILKKICSLLNPSVDVNKEENQVDLKEIKKVDSYAKAVLENAQKLLEFKGVATKAYPFALVTKAVPSHWGDGSLTKRFVWNIEKSSSPVVEIHPKAAEKLGIKDGQKVTITSEFGKVKLPVVFSNRIQEDMISADYHWADIRKLFSLRQVKGTGALLKEPIPVTLSK
jgi:predicted molibdopterin-dependent oxidoreductase YjgC